MGESAAPERSVGNVGPITSVLQASAPSPRKWDNDAVRDTVRVPDNAGKCLA